MLRKDKGYAWVVLGAGCVIMFIGTSTYTAYGTLYSPVGVMSLQRIWILNVFYSSWHLIAPLAGPLSTVNTHRKIVMFGLFVAACGLTLTAVSLGNPPWSFLTFSIIAGMGIGLAVHETFLLNLCHFERFRGLSFGLLHLSAGLGQILTPLIYRAQEEVKDRFYIRALMTAIAFMSASIYVSPYILPAGDEELVDALELQESRRSSTNTEGDEGSRGHLEEIAPLVGHQGQGEKGAKKAGHHHHHKVLPPSNHFLPKIPEEAESLCSLRSIDRSTSTIGSSDRFQVYPNQPDLHQRITKAMSVSNENQVGVGIPAPKEYNGQTVQPLGPELLAKIEKTINPKPKVRKHTNDPARLNGHHPRPPAKPTTTTNAREVNNIGMFRYRLDSIFDPEMSFMEVIGEEDKNRSEGQGIISFWKEVFAQLDFSLLKNVRFVNTAVGSAMTLVVFPNFPIVLVSYIMVLEEEAGTTDHYENVELALIYICSADMVSRLLIAHLSDFSFFNRRVGFLVGAFLGGLSIIVSFLIEDIQILHGIGCLYGMCYGTLAVTQTLMLSDSFGIDILPASYGLVNGLKAVFLLLLTPLFFPASAYMYTIDTWATIGSWNEVTCGQPGCDPLGLFSPTDQVNRLSRILHLLILIGVPGLCCGLTWTIELLWDYYSLWRARVAPAIGEPVPDPKTRSQVQISAFRGRRARSNSDPLV